MRTAVPFLALVGFVQAISYGDVLEAEWNTFTEEYNKSYENEAELQLHRQIFADNKERIDRHNKRYFAGEETYDMGVNQFTDMQPMEFQSLMLGSLNTTDITSNIDIVYAEYENFDLPSSIDWRVKGAVTPVKNQGDCPAVWAFSAVGTLEGQHFVKSRKLISLSEQNLIDCSNRPPYNNDGCRGGIPLFALKYVMDNGGIDDDKSYPYQAQQLACRFNRRNIAAKVKGVAMVKENNELALASALVYYGPISVGIDATYLQFYHSGVFNNPKCNNQINYSVLVVGYGHDSRGGDYWLVKNSWGSEWGEGGYVRMARNRNNQCKIASVAVFPLV